MKKKESYRGICGMLLAVLLLSFVCYGIDHVREGMAVSAGWEETSGSGERTAGLQASGSAGAECAQERPADPYAGQEAEICEEAGREAVIGAPDEQSGRLPCGTDYFSMARMPAGDLLGEKQYGSRMAFWRFLSVVRALFFALSAGWRFAIRNYGCRRIALWRSIIYIHKTDGKKGDAFGTWNTRLQPGCGR